MTETNLFPFNFVLCVAHVMVINEHEYTMDNMMERLGLELGLTWFDGVKARLKMLMLKLVAAGRTWMRIKHMKLLLSSVLCYSCILKHNDAYVMKCVCNTNIV